MSKSYTELMEEYDKLSAKAKQVFDDGRPYPSQREEAQFLATLAQAAATAAFATVARKQSN